MPTVRALRCSRGWTLTELAVMSGIPARTLIQIEYGHYPLDSDNRQRLAAVFELAPDLLFGTLELAYNTARQHTALLRAAPAAVVGLASALALSPLLLDLQSSAVWSVSVAPRPSASEQDTGPRLGRTDGRQAGPQPSLPAATATTALPTATPTATTPTATPASPTPSPAPTSPTATPVAPSPAPTLAPPRATVPALSTVAVPASPTATALSPTDVPPPPPPSPTAAEQLSPEIPAPPTATLDPVPSAEPPPTPTEPPPPTPTEPPPPTPTVAASPPGFDLLEDGPHGCPLVATTGRVVISQGYGVGTHAPGYLWGAVDLVLDNGNTFGAPVVATHAGVARVFPNSWPGGNFVMIEHVATGWITAYAHLDSIAVTSGQAVEAGMRIGTVGNTGFTTGPHLHYEVRRPGVGNIDPAPLIGC